MTNLLSETIKAIALMGYRPSDIAAIADEYGMRISWDNFSSVANREYDSGSGSESVRRILIYMVDGTMFYRRSDGGEEWWSLMQHPRAGRLIEDPDEVERFVWHDKET